MRLAGTLLLATLFCVTWEKVQWNVGGAVGIAADGSPILKLSVREFEIARMISDDLSDKEIAHRLQVEVSTVRTHIERIFAKLGVRRRSGVASLFARH